MTSLTKSRKLKTKNLFWLQTWRLAESFKGLNSSLAQSADVLCGCQVNQNIPDFRLFSKHAVFICRQPKCELMPSCGRFLTLWRLGGFGDFRIKNSSFRLPHQCPSSSADCTRELFKGSNRSTSLVDCTWKIFFGWGVRIVCEWRHKWSSFRVILAHVAWPRAQPLGQSVSPRLYEWVANGLV